MIGQLVHPWEGLRYLPYPKRQRLKENGKISSQLTKLHMSHHHQCATIINDKNSDISFTSKCCGLADVGVLMSERISHANETVPWREDWRSHDR